MSGSQHRTGGLFAIAGDGTDGYVLDLNYTAQYRLSDKWSKGTSLTTLEAAGFGGAAPAGLWSVSPAGVATSYVVDDLSAAEHTGRICVTHVQPLG